MDEHPDSVNDGFMCTTPVNRDFGCDLPASYHNRACGVGFADGHAEIRGWLETSTFAKVTTVMHNWDFPTRNLYRDVDWMIAHATARRRGR